MVKITTDPKTYAVAGGEVLRWVKTEAVAVSLYGVDWNKKIDDVPDAFFINYTIGDSIDKSEDFVLAYDMENLIIPKPREFSRCYKELFLLF